MPYRSAYMQQRLINASAYRPTNPTNLTLTLTCFCTFAHTKKFGVIANAHPELSTQQTTQKKLYECG